MDGMTFLLTTILLAVPITDTEGLGIRACHPEDRVMIEVVPANTNRIGGMFVTTNRALYQRDLTMIPTGTNVFRMRTICGGGTSEVREVVIAIRRPIPMPVGYPVRRYDAPPLPPGLILPLPDGTNAFPTYEAYRRHLESGKHRSE